LVSECRQLRDLTVELDESLFTNPADFPARTCLLFPKEENVFDFIQCESERLRVPNELEPVDIVFAINPIT
jgi:hypothetical protein